MSKSTYRLRIDRQLGVIAYENQPVPPHVRGLSKHLYG
jgi:hypothetical protein